MEHVQRESRGAAPGPDTDLFKTMAPSALGSCVQVAGRGAVVGVCPRAADTSGLNAVLGAAGTGHKAAEGPAPAGAEVAPPKNAAPLLGNRGVPACVLACVLARVLVRVLVHALACVLVCARS